ncbi:MAG: hypothetical protein HZB51_29305 [Chloroflexi bacterium]|nr:hypothetical protein [Chloroflexota bacterium]
MPPKPFPYQSYLLRFWQESNAPTNSARVWRFSLEDPRTGERMGFANLEHLLAFLREQMNNSPSKEKIS